MVVHYNDGHLAQPSQEIRVLIGESVYKNVTPNGLRAIISRANQTENFL